MIKINHKIKTFEEYSDFITRLYGGTSLAKSVTFQVTEACNLACTYCYQINKSRNHMSFDVAKQFIDLLLSGERGFKEYLGYDNSKAVVLEFIGGEPFLEIELIDKIVDYFRDRTIELKHQWAEHFIVSICSNGILYFDPRVQKFLEKNKNHMSFSVSIDGSKRLHDACRVFPDGKPSYDIAVAAALDWMHKGHQIGSKVTLAKENIAYLNEAIQNLVSLGYDEIHANCAYEPKWNLTDAKVFYTQLRELADFLLSKGGPAEIYCSLFESGFFEPMSEDEIQNFCGGTGRMLAIDWRGDLYPCIRYMPSSLGSLRKPICIGSVSEGLAITKDTRDCVECMKSVTRKTQSTKECFNCPIAGGCSWCSAYNYQATGTINKRVTDICIMHRARALANHYYWNKWYSESGQNKRKELYVPDDWALEIVSAEELTMLKSLID